MNQPLFLNHTLLWCV